MKKLTHSQLKAVIALNFVLITLLAGLFFMPTVSGNAPASVEPKVHERIRAGEISLNPALKWELSFGGDGENSAVAAYASGDNILVLGNGGGGLDFDYGGVFAALIDVNGVTKGFSMLTAEGDGGVLKSATVAEGGYLLAIESERPYLLLISLSGEVIRKIDGFLSGFEEVVELKYYSYGYFLLTNPAHSLTGIKRMRCVYFDEKINYLCSNLADSPYSLEKCESVVISGRVTVFCNAVSSMHTLPAVVEFPQAGSAKVTMISGAVGRIFGFSAHTGGYYLLSENGICSVLNVGQNLVLNSKITVSQHKPLKMAHLNGSHLIFCEGGLYLMDAKTQIAAVLPAFYPQNFYRLGEYILCAGETAGRVDFGIFSESGSIRNFNIDAGSSPILAIGSGIFCIYKSADQKGVKLKIAALKDVFTAE